MLPRHGNAWLVGKISATNSVKHLSFMIDWDGRDGPDDSMGFEKFRVICRLHINSTFSR